MAEVVGGPIDLQVCENCPRLDTGRSTRAGHGQADVLVSHKGIQGVYVPSNGRMGAYFQEHSTAIYMDDSESFEAFRMCAGPVKDGLLQKLGVTAAACPALEQLVGGNAADGDIIADYLERKEKALTR